MKIKFIKKTEVYEVDQVVDVTKKEAEEIVKTGFAEYVDEEVKKKSKLLKFIKEEKKKKVDEKDLEWVSQINQIFGDNQLTITKKDWDKMRALEDDERKLFLHKVQQFVESYDDEIGIWVGHVGIKVSKEKDKEKLEEAGNFISNKRNLSDHFHKVQPFFYDKAKLWWLWNFKKFCWEKTDETDILNALSGRSGADTINSKERTELLECLKQGGRLLIPKPVKNTWIQFKDLIYDIETGKEFKATPEYFITNPIPYELNKEKFMQTPTLDKIFEEWVGKKHVQTLYEIIAYCLIPDYPLHRIFCFIGGGMNGKSCFLNLIQRFLGIENVCSTELDTLLSSRFELTRLWKKLVCIMGETNFAEIKRSSILKKLSGDDLIGFEVKGGKHFEDKNYAKIIIATNNLPTTSDKTLGFYRRWLIIDFPNRFSEKEDILAAIPQEEYECLALKCVHILKDVLDKREFTNEGNPEERMKRYEEKSDPLQKFLDKFTENKYHDGHIFKWEFEKELNDWLKENRFRAMSDKTISKYMREAGYIDDRVSAEWYENDTLIKKQVRAWIGITWSKTAKTDKTANPT